MTTGTASGQVFNANMIAGDTICDCGVGGAGCEPSACTRPFSVTGHPFDCSALTGGRATGAALASMLVDLAHGTVGDVVTATRLVAPGGPPPPCFGDCNGGGQVTVDELLIMVNIGLGNAQPSACPHGIPSGGEVNIALIIQAVNHVLSGCDG